MAKLIMAIFMSLIPVLTLFCTMSTGVPISSAMTAFLKSIAAGPEAFNLLMSQVTTLDQNIQALSDIIATVELATISTTAVGQSVVFCGHHHCMEGEAFHDPTKDICVCQFAPDVLIALTSNAKPMSPTTECDNYIECGTSLLPVFNPFSGLCVCSVHLFRQNTEGTFAVRQPNKTDYEQRYKEWTRSVARRFELKSTAAANNSSTTNQATTAFSMNKLHLARRQSTTEPDAVPLPPLPDFVPPPQSEVNAALIQQSLEIKPQQNAIIHSVIPHFAEGVMTFYAQLDGPIPQSLQLNATDSLPCGAIGSQPDPNLVIVPRYVQDGSKEVVIPDCLIIAVNKVNSSWINYWVQKTDGSGAIYSLLGDAQVHDIDQLDTSKAAALSIRVWPADMSLKRDLISSIPAGHLKREQIIVVTCDHACTLGKTVTYEGTDGICGCSVNEVMHDSLTARSIDAPNAYNAVMTAEACAAMTCLNNGNKAALFNPFSNTCWCAAPTYVEVNNAAHAM